MSYFAGSVQLANTSILWHKQESHPSNFLVEKFSGQSSLKHETNKSCSICLRAKQIHDMFSLSNNNAAAIFDLIHCDLWGPYITAYVYGVFYFLTILDDFSRSVWYI